MRKLVLSLCASLALSIGAVVAGPEILQIVTRLGHNIPQDKLGDDYLFGLFWAAVLWLSIVFWPVPTGHKEDLFWLWAGKCFVLLGFMLLVENHYNDMDGYTYFDRSREGGLEWHGFESAAGTENIVNLARLFRVVLPVDSYHASKVSFGMVGLVAVYLFYRAAVLFLGYEDRRLLYILAFWPSLLFWSSLLGKEPIILLGVALYVYGAVGWHRFKRLRYLALITLGVALAMLVRLWMGPILLAPLAIFALIGVRDVVLKAVFAVFVAGIFWLAVDQFKNQFNIQTNEDALNTLNSWAQTEGGKGGSGQAVSADITDIVQFALFVPRAVFTALFRPLPGEVPNAFGWLAGIEDLALLSVAALALVRMRWKSLGDPIVLWALGLVGVWALAYGVISYVNLGTAHRYRLQILPILLSVSLYLGRRRPKELLDKRLA